MAGTEGPPSAAAASPDEVRSVYGTMTLTRTTRDALKVRVTVL